jgi:hypothetical protein
VEFLETVLASATVAEASIGDSFGWVSVPLSPGAEVTAGSEYAIVLSAPAAAGFPTAIYVWSFAFENPYPAGKLSLSGTSGASWGEFAQVFDQGDAAFVTYVTPPPPLPTTFVQCFNGDWANFPDFENQGDCISFVATKGGNQPG